jgi:hypothetical protein
MLSSKAQNLRRKFSSHKKGKERKRNPSGLALHKKTIVLGPKSIAWAPFLHMQKSVTREVQKLGAKCVFFIELNGVQKLAATNNIP